MEAPQKNTDFQWRPHSRKVLDIVKCLERGCHSLTVKDAIVVAETPSSGLPLQVTKRDGRVVPFEADKISQALYAATEDLRRPSAFLARELTDGVLHFLKAELGPEQPTTGQIAELIVKVVRELGHPALAQAYAERQSRDRHEAGAKGPREKAERCAGTVRFTATDAPGAVVRRCLEAYSLQAVFARDLAAAHQEGLMSLTGLEHPEELARNVQEPSAGAGDWLALVNVPARTLIFDSPEHALTEETARPWLRGLAEFCEATGRQAILNLHVDNPPAWAAGSAHGPLFGLPASSAGADRALAVSAILLDEHDAIGAAKSVRVDWHLGEIDFRPERTHQLDGVVRQAGKRRGLGFALDRARRPVALGQGADRRHGAVLLDVRLNLPHFLNMAGVGGEVRVFLEKLPSLARMAVRAGVQKRNFLRRQGGSRPGLVQGFLLERAWLTVVPAGLDDVVHALSGQGMVRSKLSLDLGRQIITILHDTLQVEGLAANLEVALDDAGERSPEPADGTNGTRLQAAAVVHGITGFGTAVCDPSVADDGEFSRLLAFAWRRTDVVRVAIGDPR
jgi:hypothetical protein